MSIILIGFMGAGKSTVAKLLTENFTDLDQLIEEEICLLYTSPSPRDCS